LKNITFKNINVFTLIYILWYDMINSKQMA